MNSITKGRFEVKQIRGDGRPLKSYFIANEETDKGDGRQRVRDRPSEGVCLWVFACACVFWTRVELGFLRVMMV